MAELPKNYDHKLTEQKLLATWEAQQVYYWDESKTRDETFVVDTPPPTVSGSLHVGHVFSYTHTDLIARYQRMLGKNIMYPMGWDDNGLPTERRVQNKFGITCEPSLPYDPNWKPTEAPASLKRGDFQAVSRRNFIEACALVTHEDEAAFEDLWRKLGLSIDWRQTYATIDEHSRHISQLSFIDLVEKGFVYSSESPTMWDVDYRTALAQADLEDREQTGNYHDIEFAVEDGETFVISTTRPELLVSCVAVVAHPSDVRYQKYFGKNAITPLFGARVPILAADHADPEKGTGILMICTFGDIADVQWWKSSGLPIKQSIALDGRMKAVDFTQAPFASVDAKKAEAFYAEVVGKTAKQAREKMAELLGRDGSAARGNGKALVGALKPTTHPVKFYEKGDRPIEFVTTRQWFVKVLDFKEQLLEQGSKIAWHPPFMRSRYDNWVAGLSHDWCISRQRFFGVSFPVWYRLDAGGDPDYQNPIYATREMLPVDPLSDTAPGFDESARGKPNGFIGDPDVMDTWATSSLTPQLASHWGLDDKRAAKLSPSDIRPQSHEIIRTWAFYTIAKSWMHLKEIPWKNIIISGWILDPDRKKMSKSKGNTITPGHLLEQYSSDGVRYWAARARLGVDTAFDEKVFKNGQKLATKLFNASKFVIMQTESYISEQGTPAISAITDEIDRNQVAKLRQVITEATQSFEQFDYAAALQTIEASFWGFCDCYVELVKARAYQGTQEERASAVATLSWSLQSYLKLLAPFMPYVTDEIWSWGYAAETNTPSIHKATWPNVVEVATVKTPSEEGVLDIAAELLGKIHYAKSQAQKSLRWPVDKMELSIAKSDAFKVNVALADVIRAGRVRDDGVAVSETLASGGAQRFEVAITLSETAE